MRRILLSTIASVLMASTSLAQSDTAKGDAAAGRQLYEIKGCYSCHGYVGQGSREGPRLTPPAAYAAFVVQLRTPRLIMPPYVESVVSDAQVADIYAYLANVPKPPDPKTIDLLK